MTPKRAEIPMLALTPFQRSVAMKRVVTKFGLLSGATIAVLMLLQTWTIQRIGVDKVGPDRGAIVGYTTMVLSFMLVYFGVRSYRDTEGGGQVSFGRALRIGLLISLITSVCYVAAWEVVYYTILPDFAEQFSKYAVDKVRASGGSEAQVEAKRQEMLKFQTMYKNPFYNAAITFTEPLPVALVFAFVSAGIVSRKRDEDAVLAPDSAPA
jgi:hypothetical protein